MNNSRFVLKLIASFILLFSSCTKSLKDIVKDVEKATFIIYTYDEFGSPNGSGSGFFINQEGIAVTNYHVLDKSVKATIKISDGSEYEINSVLSASSKKDLVVFSIKNPGNKKFPTLKFIDEKPEKGVKIYNIGSPLGLESSVSEGIVSSYREDSHGSVVQITAPISPGSSGSPILTERGKVFAVATFQRRGGQNLNFGVIVNNDIIDLLDAKEFEKSNPKFNSKGNFVILNLPPKRGSDIILNAIEFSNTATILYLTYTNLHLSSGGEWMLWCEIGLKDEGFFIEDKDTRQRYYLTSSTLATTKNEAKSIDLAKSVQFKVYFPSIRKELNKLDVIWGNTSRGSQWPDIELDNYRESLKMDDSRYLREYAIKLATENQDFSESIQILNSLIDKNSSDALALNTLGIISYALDNNNDAIRYFTKSIDKNPNDELGYINRAQVYEFQKNYQSAINDVTSAINIVPDQPDYYYYRATYNLKVQNFQGAKDDIDKCLSCADDFKSEASLYYFRAVVNLQLNQIEAAKIDIQASYKLSKDKELDKMLQELWNKLN